jgi:ectoine hydroxylase-related dioxygenase (phytanoyl-CoA dioxygenase family)
VQSSPGSPSYLRHVSSFFGTGVLSRARDYFVERERTGWTAKDEREGKRIGIGAAPNDFRLDEKWYEVWQDVSAVGLNSLGEFSYVLFPVHIRHVTQEVHLVPWHQDAAYMALMPKRHSKVITCFVPVEPHPAEVSTLEFAPGDYPLLPHEAKGDHGAAIERESFANTTRFDLSFGDALLFGDHVPHRTVPGRNGIDRRSFEFRMTRPEDALPGKDYFDLSSRAFVRTDASGK